MPKKNNKNKKNNKKKVSQVATVPAALSNVFMNRSPNIHYDKDGVTVRHREYVGAVRADSTGKFLLDWIDLNPSKLPWLGSVARNYEYYRYAKVSLIYVTSVSTNVGGTVVLFPDMDDKDRGPIDMSQSLAMCNAVRCPVYFTCKCSVPEASLKLSPARYVREMDEADDGRWTNVGWFGVATQGASVSVVGDLVLEYTIMLNVPQSPRLPPPAAVKSAGTTKFINQGSRVRQNVGTTKSLWSFANAGDPTLAIDPSQVMGMLDEIGVPGVFSSSGAQGSMQALLTDTLGLSHISFGIKTGAEFNVTTWSWRVMLANWVQQYPIAGVHNMYITWRGNYKTSATSSMAAAFFDVNVYGNPSMNTPSTLTTTNTSKMYLWGYDPDVSGFTNLSLSVGVPSGAGDDNDNLRISISDVDMNIATFTVNIRLNLVHRDSFSQFVDIIPLASDVTDWFTSVSASVEVN